MDLEWETPWDSIGEEEFQRTFRMSRRSAIALQAELDERDGAPAENVASEEADRDLLFCLRYLGCTAPSTAEAAPSALVAYAERIGALADAYLAWPDDDEFRSIEEGFERGYGFPGVAGVLGSLHIDVKSDVNDRSYYNEDAKKDTIVLQIVSDNNMLIRDVCAGRPGGNSVEEILKSSPLYRKLRDENGFLVRNDRHLLGGTSHPQMRTLLTPYKGRRLTERQNRFNVLHSSVMFNVEQTFRCIENRFPRLTAGDSLSPSICTLLATAVCVLHNFTRVRNDNCNAYM